MIFNHDKRLLVQISHTQMVHIYLQSQTLPAVTAPTLE